MTGLHSLPEDSLQEIIARMNDKTRARYRTASKSSGARVNLHAPHTPRYLIPPYVSHSMPEVQVHDYSNGRRGGLVFSPSPGHFDRTDVSAYPRYYELSKHEKALKRLGRNYDKASDDYRHVHMLTELEGVRPDDIDAAIKRKVENHGKLKGTHKPSQVYAHRQAKKYAHLASQQPDTSRAYFDYLTHMAYWHRKGGKIRDAERSRINSWIEGENAARKREGVQVGDTIHSPQSLRRQYHAGQEAEMAKAVDKRAKWNAKRSRM